MTRFANSSGAAPPLTTVPDVTVGIDFGTSSIKVAFREFGGQQSVLIPSPDGTPLWPAVVRKHDDRLYFAESIVEEDQPIRWLKMLLAEEFGTSADWHRDEMRLRIEQTGCSIHCLATLLLAHVIRHTKRRIAEFYEAQRQPAPHLTFNMGAPLESFAMAHQSGSNRVASDGFQKALYWGARIADQVPEANGWVISDARRAFESVRDVHCTLPPQAGRTEFVVPETHAVVTGTVLGRRRLESGQYAIIDIGAGTTDVAVFCYQESARKNGRWAVTYLADAVKHEASTHADRCIAELIWDRMYQLGLHQPADGEMLELARSAKERTQGKQGAIVLDRIQITTDDFRNCVEELGNRLFLHYKKTLINAVRDKTKSGHREPYYLQLLGGGSRFQPFRNRFIGIQPDANYESLRPIETWDPSQDYLRVLGADRLHNVPGQDYQLYSLVHGLTTHIVRIPDFWLPSEVDDFPRPPPADIGPYLRNDDT